MLIDDEWPVIRRFFPERIGFERLFMQLIRSLAQHCEIDMVEQKRFIIANHFFKSQDE
jgi:hypothetical protein